MMPLNLNTVDHFVINRTGSTYSWDVIFGWKVKALIREGSIFLPPVLQKSSYTGQIIHMHMTDVSVDRADLAKCSQGT